MNLMRFKEYNKHIIYTVLLMCIIVLVNLIIIKYVKNEQEYQDQLKLLSYQKVIQALIVDNIIPLQKSNVKHQHNIQQQTSAFKDYIKNQVFVTRSSLGVKEDNNYLGYINLQELLDEMSDQIFNYIIYVNDQQIVGNAIINTEVKLVKKYLINSELLFTVFIQINPDSIYANDVKARMKKLIDNLIVASCIIFFCLITVIYYLLNRDKKIINKLKQLDLYLHDAMERNKNIILFREKDKAFILKCYQYSKNVKSKESLTSEVLNFMNIENRDYNAEYLPLPLFLQQEQSDILHKFLLKPMVTELEDYFKGYVAYYNMKMTLEITFTEKEIVVPFDKEVFSQIIISLFCNMLYFNKDPEGLKYIKLAFKKNRIYFSSNGFLLDHNLAIRYSEKIFNDTGNMYLLNLGQIFVFIKKYKLDYVVFVQGEETIIELKLDTHRIKVNNINNVTNKNKIVHLDKFKKKKIF